MPSKNQQSQQHIWKIEEQAHQQHTQSEIVGYEWLVMSTVLYGAELWPLRVAQKKKLEAAHHKFQRRMMGISWKVKVSNESVRAQTLEKIDLFIKERRLRWLGHVLRMDDNRLPSQAVHWDISGTKRKRGRPQKNSIDTIQQDLKSIGMTSEVAQQLAVNRGGWRRRVVQMCL